MSNAPQTAPLAKAAEPVKTVLAKSAQVEEWELIQRKATAFAHSSLVPANYQNNVPNVLIAMEMAHRIGASVMMVMQNLYVVHGAPSWSSKFLIATVNASGRFTPLRFRFEGKAGTDDWGCRAVAHDTKTDEECIGPLVTIAVAKAEGWATKNGSKWKTLPELMLQYRAAAFWTRLYAPELSLGMQTTEELADVTGEVHAAEAPSQEAIGDAKALEAQLLGETKPADDEPDFGAGGA